MWKRRRPSKRATEIAAWENRKAEIAAWERQYAPEVFLAKLRAKEKGKRGVATAVGGGHAGPYDARGRLSAWT